MADIRPRLALRLGVTGHRAGRLTPDAEDAIRATISRVFTDVAATCAAIHSATQNLYRPDAPALSLVTPLASGADTIAAEVALAHQFDLAVVLPFSRDRVADNVGDGMTAAFAALLDKAVSVMELTTNEPGGEEDSDRAYYEAGATTLRHTDILVAVWDGARERGVGGTGMIVRMARRLGMPVIWIPLDAPNSARLLLGEEDSAFGRPLLHSALETVLLPGGAETRADDVRLLNDFESEKPRRKIHGVVVRRVNRLLVGKPAPGLRTDAWAPPEAAPDTPDADVLNLLRRRYVHADQSAIRYADIYRSSYYLNYILSAVAVFLALLEIGIGFGKTLWISIEVGVILSILLITARGQKRGWHQKWLDYRQLTELFRRYHAVFAVGGSLGVDADGPRDRELRGNSRWANWYFDATVREMGLATVRLSTDRKKAVLAHVISTEIDPQIQYHEHNHHTKHHLAHRLHVLGEWAFGATLTVCLIFLLMAFLSSQDWAPWAYDTKKAIKGWVTVLTGFLPALGAALFGIRVQGEFATVAEKSAIMVDDLKRAKSRLEALMAEPDPSISDVRSSIVDAARIAIAENAEWRIVFQGRPLNLPG